MEQKNLAVGIAGWTDARWLVGRMDERKLWIADAWRWGMDGRELPGAKSGEHEDDTEDQSPVTARRNRTKPLGRRRRGRGRYEKECPEGRLTGLGT